MAFGFFDPQKGQTATGIAQSRAMAAALLRSGGAPRNVGEGLNSIGDAIFYRSLIGDADASEKTQTDAFNSSFNSLIAPYAGGGQVSAVPMPTAAGEVSATAPASNGVAAALMANDGSELGKYLSDDGLRSKLPAGMRNNNPGNIKFVGQKVPGIVGPSVNTDQGDPQAVFDTPENGMRAMYSLLGKKYAGGKVTPNQLIAGNMGWTPGNYDAAANVARYAGIGPDDDIGFTDPARASRFMQGLITQEHGKAGAMYPLAMIQSAIGGNTQVASATPVTATDAIEAVAPQPGYRDPQVTTAYTNPAPATASAPPLSAPTTISAAPAVAESAPMAAPQQVAQNFQPQQIDPRLIEAANSPFATPGQKAILGGIIQQQQAKNEFIFKQQQSEALQAKTVAERVAVAQSLGINPAFAQDEEVWKQAVSQANGLAAPSVSTVNGVGYDNRSHQPIFGTPDKPTSVQEYEYGVNTPGYFDQQEKLRRSGANTAEGSIPTGYSAVRDSQGKVLRYEPISGGPADTSAKTAASNESKLTSTDVITNAANLARAALKAPGLGSTGTMGKLMSGLPESNAAELRRQVKVLTSNATIENLNAMRQQSPTGGALGNVTEGEGAMLAAKAGVLDPNSPNFERDLDDYERTMLRIVHGKDKGDQVYDQSRGTKEKPMSEMTDDELRALIDGK